MDKKLNLKIIKEVLYNICLYTQKNKIIDETVRTNICRLCFLIGEELKKLSDNTVYNIMIKLIEISKTCELEKDILTRVKDKLDFRVERLKKFISNNASKRIIINECKAINNFNELYVNLSSYHE